MSDYPSDEFAEEEQLNENEEEFGGETDAETGADAYAENGGENESTRFVQETDEFIEDDDPQIIPHESLSRETDELFMNDSSQPPVIVNEGMKRFFNKLFNHVDAKNSEFSDIFDCAVFAEFNAQKRFDVRHTKYSVDRFGLLIRENKYNKRNDPYGWILIDGEPININVTQELMMTKTPEEIFDIVMTDLTTRRRRMNLTNKSLPTQLFKILDRDITKYVANEEAQ